MSRGISGAVTVSAEVVKLLTLVLTRSFSMDSPHRDIDRRDNFLRSTWLLRYNRGHDASLTIITDGSYAGHVEIITECRVCRQSLNTANLQERNCTSAACRYSEV